MRSGNVWDIPIKRLPTICWNLPRQTVAELFDEHRVEIVITHPYEGGHPDHDAAAFAVQTAVQLLESKTPLIIEAPFYHQGPHGIETGLFLNCAESEELVYTLSEKERAQKQELMDCFTTQKDTLQYFSTKTERYRASPQYLFAKPPHPGRAFYDHLDWGITSDQFCSLASKAETKLTSARPARC